jgi:hypothetical protein
LAIAGAAMSLAGCNNGSSPSVTPTLGPTCTLPAGTQVALVYPAPGSTGVVDGNGEIVIGASPALPVNQSGENWDIWYSDAVTGGAFASLNPGTSLTTVAPPFPTPNQTPSFANPVYQEQSSGVQFAASQVVTVYVNNTASNCTPLQIGTFST